MRLRAVFSTLALLLAIGLPGAFIWQLSDASPPRRGAQPTRRRTGGGQRSGDPDRRLGGRAAGCSDLSFRPRHGSGFDTVTVRSRIDGQLQAPPLSRGGGGARRGCSGNDRPASFASDFTGRWRPIWRRDQAQLRSAEAELERTRKAGNAGFGQSPRAWIYRPPRCNSSKLAIDADQAQIDNAKIQL